MEKEKSCLKRKIHAKNGSQNRAKKKKKNCAKNSKVKTLFTKYIQSC